MNNLMAEVWHEKIYLENTILQCFTTFGNSSVAMVEEPGLSVRNVWGKKQVQPPATVARLYHSTSGACNFLGVGFCLRCGTPDVTKVAA